MLMLRQLVIIAFGCVVGTVAAGFFLAATAPAATRSLDYLLAAMVFLLGFAAGTAVAGRVTAGVPLLQSAPNSGGEPEIGLELGPVVERSSMMHPAVEDLSRSL